MESRLPNRHYGHRHEHSPHCALKYNTLENHNAPSPKVCYKAGTACALTAYSYGDKYVDWSYTCFVVALKYSERGYYDKLIEADRTKFGRQAQPRPSCHWHQFNRRLQSSNLRRRANLWNRTAVRRSEQFSHQIGLRMMPLAHECCEMHWQLYSFHLCSASSSSISPSVL